MKNAVKFLASCLIIATQAFGVYAQEKPISTKNTDVGTYPLDSIGEQIKETGVEDTLSKIDLILARSFLSDLTIRLAGSNRFHGDDVAYNEDGEIVGDEIPLVNHLGDPVSITGARTFCLGANYAFPIGTKTNCLFVSSGLEFESKYIYLENVIKPKLDTENPMLIPEKLTILYLSTPLMLSLKFVHEHYWGRRDPNLLEVLGLHLGVVPGVRLDSYQSYIKIRATSPKEVENIGKVRVHDDFNLTPFRLDFIARAKLGFFTLSYRHSLSNMFKRGQGPDIYFSSVVLEIDLKTFSIVLIEGIDRFSLLF